MIFAELFNTVGGAFLAAPVAAGYGQPATASMRTRFKKEGIELVIADKANPPVY